MFVLRRITPFRSEAVLLLAGLGIVGLVVGSQLFSASSFERYHSLVGVVSHIKQTITESHIWLEERLSGDTTVDEAAQIQQPLVTARADCQAVISGGQTDIGSVQAIGEADTSQTVAALCARIGDLAAVAAQRLSAASSSGVGTAIDTKFDDIFHDVISLADRSSAGIDGTLEAERATVSTVNAAIAILAATLVVGLVVLVDRYRRSTDRTKLEHASAGAEARSVLVGAQQEAERAAVLNRLADRVTFGKGEADLVAAALAALQRLVPSPEGDVLLLNASQDRLMIAASWGATDSHVGRPARVESPELCPGIRRGSVYALDDAEDDLAVACEAHPIKTGSLLCVPMLALGKSVGVLHVARPEIGSFDARTQQLASRVAEQVALGLANARLLQTMERLAMADPLTGLHNARFFDPLVDRELATAQREGTDLGIVMVDIDHFKRFNDTHGHPGGDEALKAFARAAKSALRESDSIARYGGEEFAILVRGGDVRATALVAEKVRAAVEGTVVDLGPNRADHITVSLGVSSTSSHGRDRMLLMRIADAALYRAKETGRNRVVVADGRLEGAELEERPAKLHPLPNVGGAEG